MTGREVRQAEQKQATHSFVLDVDDAGQPRLTYLGVQLGDLEGMTDEELSGRILGLNRLLVSRDLPRWLVEGIGTEVGLLEAVSQRRRVDQGELGLGVPADWLGR